MSSAIIMITVTFFMFIFVSGFWLSRTGKPYKPLVITLHKLIGLGTGIYLVVFTNRNFHTDQLSTTGIIALAITVMLFLGLVASGGLLSAEKSFSSRTSSIHKILPYIAMVSTIFLIYIIS